MKNFEFVKEVLKEVEKREKTDFPVYEDIENELKSTGFEVE